MALITDLDDRSLVEHHHAGDEDAFRQIVERHGRSLYANALRRLHDPVLAEDAVQEALLRAFRALPKFNGEYHLDAWLHRILTNVCHDIGRRQGRDTRLFDRVSGEHDVAAPPADDGVEAMPRQQLESALDSLPASYREVLLLRFADELSYADVAIKAGISEENARARVSRGRAMLRRLLEGASAAVFWLIPPLRRNQLTGVETDVAHEAGQHLSNASNLASSAAPIMTHAAPAASQSTSVLTQATTFVSQTVPGLVQAAPAVSSSAPAMGKAAVAVGLAAAAAIPAGVAVEKHFDQPTPPAVAAPAQDAAKTLDPEAPVEVETPAKADPATATSTSSPSTTVVVADDVAALGDGGAIVLSPSTTSTTDTTATDGSTTTTAPSTTTTTAPTTTTTVPDGSTGGATEPTPPPPPGDLSAAVTVTESGPSLVLDGAFTLDVDGHQVTGTFSGAKVNIGEPGKDPDAPRDIWSDRILLQFDDGTTAELQFKGTVTITTRGKDRFYDFTAIFRLDGGPAHQLAGSGDLAGTLQVRDGSGKLALNLPGASAES